MDNVKVHDGWVLRMVHVDDLGVVASASADCTVKIMKLESREILCVCLCCCSKCTVCQLAALSL